MFSTARSLPVSLPLLLSGILAATAAHGAKHRSLVQLFNDVNPAVVVLTTVERQVAPGQPQGEVSLPGLGSGVLVDSKGHIVTAAHVVQTADLVEARFIDGTEVMAEIVSSDPSSDLALVKVDAAAVPKRIKPAKLGDSDKVAVGAEVFVIGAPYGLEHSLTVGHISGRHRGDSETPTEQRAMVAPDAEMFQTDAAVNQGNSGGPMFDMEGNVIGIVSYILSKSGGFEGLGFAVTSNTVRTKLFERPSFWSGMTAVPISGGVAAAFNVPQPVGYLVQKVARDSPAERMGLKPSRLPITVAGQTILIGGDIILSVAGMEISPDRADAIQAALDALQERDSVTIRVLRAGKIEEVEFYGFYKPTG